MQHQPNIAAALSVATHRNGPVAIRPAAGIPDLIAALDAGDVDGAILSLNMPVYDLPATEWSPVVEVRC